MNSSPGITANKTKTPALTPLSTNSKPRSGSVPTSSSPTTKHCNEGIAGKSTSDSYLDLTIAFFGANGLPKMDLQGRADPFFVAELGNLTYTSHVKVYTVDPVWNETWVVKNVPSIARLSVTVKDKDDLTDDTIGKFDVVVSEKPRSKQIMSGGKKQGQFFLEIQSQLSQEHPNRHPYTFDGPVRFMRCNSRAMGRLIGTKSDHPWVTHKIYLKGVHDKFGNVYQMCNPDHSTAKLALKGGFGGFLVETMHSVLYDPKKGDEYGIIWHFRDLLKLLRSPKKGGLPSRVKPMIYTYIFSADDDTFRFSETGPALLNNLASKHALHADCNTKVRFSGEFHPRPKGGWSNFSDRMPDDEAEWELVIDNNSGTYAPNKSLLPAVKGLLELNFPGIQVCTYELTDKALEESKKACIDYALDKRHVKREEIGLDSFFDVNDNDK